MNYSSTKGYCKTQLLVLVVELAQGQAQLLMEGPLLGLDQELEVGQQHQEVKAVHHQVQGVEVALVQG